MTEPPPSNDGDPGAPIPRDEIDPDLVKLPRTRLNIGVITAAGVVFLCALVLVRLHNDRVFSGNDTPDRVDVAAVLGGRVATERYIELEAEPMMSHSIRTTTAKASQGLRVTPVRGAGDRLWVVLPGDGWSDPSPSSYTGRLRKLTDLAFSDALDGYAEQHPRPVFASPAAVRAGFSTNRIKTVAGDTMRVADQDVVAFDVIEPELSTIVASYTDATDEHGPLLDAASWNAALAKAGITPLTTPTKSPAVDSSRGSVQFEVRMSAADASSKLEAAKLWAARVQPVSRHYRTTWGALRSASPTGFVVASDAGQLTIADGRIDLMGLYVMREIPSDAYAVITGERPEDYWYVLPITIALSLIGLLFTWALVRAVRREVLPVRVPG